jgi:hypothetical protein
MNSEIPFPVGERSIGMTRAEAEVFIKTVIGPGDVMDIDQIRQKYRDMTLQEALRDHLGKIADDVEPEDGEDERSPDRQQPGGAGSDLTHLRRKQAFSDNMRLASTFRLL